MVLYKALSKYGSVLQRVRALKRKRKDYTTEEIILGTYPYRLSLQVVEPPKPPIDSNRFQ